MSEVAEKLGGERPAREAESSAAGNERMQFVDSNEVLETYLAVKERIRSVLTEAGIPPDEPIVQKLARELVAGFFQGTSRPATEAVAVG